MKHEARVFDVIYQTRETLFHRVFQTPRGEHRAPIQAACLFMFEIQGNLWENIEES